MRTWRTRLFISVIVALFLPVPNPHVTDYVPLIQAAIHDPNAASLSFWILLAVFLSVYTGVVFVGLSAVTWFISRRRPR